MVNKFTAPGVVNRDAHHIVNVTLSSPFLTPLHRIVSLQLFMCLLWCLIQLVVVFMYWDLTPPNRGRTNDASDSEDRKGPTEDEGDEEKPLMASQEVAGSYGSVATPDSSKRRCDPATSVNHVSSATPLLPDSDKPSSTSRSFCFSRGGCSGKGLSAVYFFICSFIYLFLPWQSS